MHLRLPVIPLLLFLALLLPLPAAPDDATLSQLLDAEAALLTQEIEAQRSVDALADQSDTLVREYEDTLERISQLEPYTRRLAALVERQTAQLAEFDDAFAAARETEREIVPMMERMVDALERIVDADLPFLLEERRTRIGAVRDVMRDPSVPLAEQYRRVLEVYQVEMEYGRTIEAWQGKIELAGRERAVELLRIGRLALFFLSPDHKRVGRWNEATGEWLELEPRWIREVTHGMQIARRELPPDMLVLPVTAP